jgi:hypothetical protein
MLKMKLSLFLLVFVAASTAVASDFTLSGHIRMDAGKMVLWNGSWGITQNAVSNSLEFVQGTARVTVSTDGNAGIGTTIPTRRLAIRGTGTDTAFIEFRHSANDVPYVGLGYDETNDGLAFKLNLGISDLNGTAMFIKRGGSTHGNVGIGTIAPSQRLEVAGWGGSPATAGVTQNGITRIFNPTANTSIDSGLLAGAPYSGWIQVTQPPALGNYFPLALNPNGGSVGIGTLEPTDKLHIVGSGTGSTSATLRLRNVTTGAIHTAAVSLERGDTNGFAQVNFLSGSDAVPPTYWAVGLRLGNQKLRFYDGQLGVDRMSLSTTGLEVTGDISASGIIYAKFQDMAEWVPADEAIAAGTVVIVAPQNHVVPSTEEYDTRIAGVVSAQPGVVLGERGESKVLVATTGRVKVRVDASHGAIREGDLLVSSPTKGTAMKSEPILLNGRKFHQPGTVIGKALEPLASGTGEILVLLSLQ